MRLKTGRINGLRFVHRLGTSDLKTFEEVIGRNVYEKRGNRIEAGESWVDCGGNVGAFALLAKSKGAEVEIWEPDPFCCEMIEKNLKLNGFSAKINQAALVHQEDLEKVTLFVGKNQNFWRNSVVKNWQGRGVKVPAVFFDDAMGDGVCVKMDIEGAEMPILEKTKRRFKKLVFEWSFDIDDRFERYWAVLDRLRESYKVECSEYRDKGYTHYPKNWFPMCENVFCYEKG